jgi:hypothetical protein
MCPTCYGSGYLPGTTLFCTEDACPDRQRVERTVMNYLVGADLRGYNPERHDPDSVFFDDSYVGASELELGGGCNRCGCPDDCMCNG